MRDKSMAVKRMAKLWPRNSLYAVTKKGEIWSLKTARFLKPRDNGKGYKTVSINDNKTGKVRYHYIHRMVLETFVGIRIDKDVNHKNGDKGDNRLINLEYCTKKQNMNHAFKQLDRHNGENHYKTKITKQQYKEILNLSRLGISNSEIARKYGYKSSYSITRIIRGERWKHTNV